MNLYYRVHALNMQCAPCQRSVCMRVVCYRTMGSPLSESPSEKERSTNALYCGNSLHRRLLRRASTQPVYGFAPA